MSKFIKTLIIINGILIPLMIISFVIVMIASYTHSWYRHNPPAGVNTENTIVENGDTLVEQGLSYASPEPVYNSTNFIISIKPKTFDEPQEMSSGNKHFSKSDNATKYTLNELNVLFLDKNYKVIGRLLDKKASIKTVEMANGSDPNKVDTSVKNLAYEIAFNDDNEDGVIDDNDSHDLYISNLSGKELTQVTKAMDVNEFQFIDNHSALMISYTDRSDLSEENKINRFAIYTLTTKQLRKLTDIDNGLSDIQKILNQ